MSNDRNIKVRKRNAGSMDALNDKREAKSSLIGKVNDKDKLQQGLERKSKGSLASKVNQPEVTKVETPPKANSAEMNNISAKPVKESKQQVKKDKKEPKAKKEKKPNFISRSFFGKLSIVGRVMLVIYIISFLTIGGLLINTLMHRGQPIYGSRELPVRVISDEQVEQVRVAVTEEVTEATQVMVDYTGFRMVIAVELGSDANLTLAREVNNRILDVVDGIIPIEEYFHSDEKLNNDIFIYSTDVMPSDFETNSRFILQTHKNSRMAEPSTHNLLAPRDEESAQEVIDSMERAGN